MAGPDLPVGFDWYEALSADIPDTLELRIATFLRRWSWKSDCSATVRRELDELIAFAKDRPCGGCGTTVSADGDWYRLCGQCRWKA